MTKTGGFEKKTDSVKIISCAAVICVFALIGLLFFARPSYSEDEKRNLTPFPSFTWDSFFSGEYFSQISLWYADTYPLREGMISVNSSIQSIYGDRDEQLITPVGGTPAPDGGDVTDGGAVVQFEGIWLQKDTNTAFETYNFNKGNTDRYISLINLAGEKLNGKADVYDIVVPLHYTYRLTDKQIAQIGSSDCAEAVDYIYSGLSDKVTSVDAHSQLWAHKDEYIYYRTDHHWTARGAYYAYVAFCKAKGTEPIALEDYERLQFDGFLGSLYANANKPTYLKDNPDYVEAFVPMGTNKIQVTDKNGNEQTYQVVNKNTDTWYPAAGAKYNCFIAGDNPISEIHNPDINDGSSVVIIKESYGNAFVPFLVDSYEYVYVIDYRYYSGDLTTFVEENGVDDVIFLNTVTVTSTEQRLDKIEALIGK